MLLEPQINQTSNLEPDHADLKLNGSSFLPFLVIFVHPTNMKVDNPEFVEEHDLSSHHAVNATMEFSGIVPQISSNPFRNVCSCPHIE